MADVNKFSYANSGKSAVVRTTEEHITKIQEEFTKKRLANETAAHEERLKKMTTLQSLIYEAEAKGDKRRKKLLETSLNDLKKDETQYANQIQELKKEAAERAAEYDIAAYKKMSLRKKMETTKEAKAELDQHIKQLQIRQAAEESMLEKLRNQGDLTAEEQQKVKDLETSIANYNNELQDAQSKQKVMGDQLNKLFDGAKNKSDKAVAANYKYELAIEDLNKAREESEDNIREAEDKLAAARETNNKDAEKAAKDELKKQQRAAKSNIASAEKLVEAAEKAKKGAEAAEKAEDKTFKKRLKNSLSKEQAVEAVNAVSAAMSNAVDSRLDAVYGNQGRMMGRLQGTDFNWSKAVDNVSSVIGFSGSVSQQKVIEHMIKLVDSGVAYNLELRAFLAETSENIASTFDAFDSNLLRVIRLQQSDSTAARLGMEAELTELFNQYFEDSSYLADNIADTVSGAILDASATMSRDDSLAFEYVVQKWLGSLYSLGMSSEAVTSIAQGINYLSTGNVEALAGNSSLQTLFSLSASRTKKSYSDMLVGGISAAETNDLLKAIVEILSGLSDSDNRVVSSAYAGLFGMSLTDLRTFSSLSTTDIKNIYKNTASYSQLVKNTENQLDQISNRLNSSQIVDNIINNAMLGAAQNIGANHLTYGVWKALNIVDELVKLEIPGITAVGTGTTSGIDILNAAKGAYAGLGLVTSMIEAFQAGGNRGLDLSAWKFSDTTKRGSTLPILKIGSASGTSYSAMLGVGGPGAEDVQTVSFETAQDSAYDRNGTTSEEQEKQKELPQQIYDALAGDGSTTVLSLLEEINERLAPSRVFYTGISSSLSSGVTAAQVTNLSTQVSSAKAVSIDSVEDQTKASVNNTVSNSSNSGVSGTTNILDNDSGMSLETVIAAAIAEGLRQYSFANKLPVEVTTYGGGL